MKCLSKKLKIKIEKISIQRITKKIDHHNVRIWWKISKPITHCTPGSELKQEMGIVFEKTKTH